jgi:hypothetical protein
MFSYGCRFAFGAMLTAAALAGRGQDPHAIGLESMKTWYNPALKTDKEPLVNFNYRKVDYPGILSYNSKSATLELPFVPADEYNDDNVPYASLALGINVDNADNRLMNASAAMLGLAYALPLDYNNTYLALGLQVNWSFNKIGNGQTITFPSKFDQAGALNWSLQMDPYQSGYNFNFFTVGTGFSFFHSGEKSQWYAGVAVRDFNHPYTEWNRANRLQTSYGIQSGYALTFNSEWQAATFVNLYWQNGPLTNAREQMFSCSASRTINVSDSSSFKVSLGMGIRPADALMPMVGFHYGKSQFMVYFELNSPGIASRNYNRKAFDVSYNLNF